MASVTTLIRAAGLMLLFAAIVSPGDCLRCYVCSKEQDPECETRPKAIKECVIPEVLGFQPVCVKAEFTVNDEYSKGVIRDCTGQMPGDDACLTAGVRSSLEVISLDFCETCYTDLCNGGSQLMLSSALYLFPFIYSLILYLMW